ncbi:MAG: hypothetical protein HFJ49_03085 [Clostridia bacterium]|jgi:hypothetical protein|nr:hypothetical protein [Clostridia bacterium]
MSTKKKTVIEHIEQLIEFYNIYDTTDERLKKLIIRNLKDVKRRAENEREEKKDEKN